MSEETKKDPAGRRTCRGAQHRRAGAPETAPEQAAAPETNAEAADPKKKDGFFNKRPGSWRP